jgi:hypothetical protein
VLVRLWKPKGVVIIVRRFVPAKTDGGVGYLKAVGRQAATQENEHFRQMDGVVTFTSVDSRSERNKKKGEKTQKSDKYASDSV